MQTKPRRVVVVLTAFALFAAAPWARAADATDEGLQLVRDFVDNVKTMSARFEQTLVDADGRDIESSAGTMQIERPGRFRWTYDEPYEQVLVADGRNVWNYDVDLAQVTVKPQEDLLGNTPALLLGGSANVLDDFEFVDSSTDRGIVWVRLRPRDTDAGFTRVELGFDERQLRRMIFVDTLEQSTLVGLFDVVINEPIADERFAFSPPPDADLVGTPVPPDDAGS